MKTIPQQLRERPQWVNWKSIERGGKATKVPFQPNGFPAKSTDPATWSKFEDLASGGIGFVFSMADPFIGIDFDGCRDTETGLLDPWAKEAVLKFGSYAEVSPSGTGVKIFGIASQPWNHKNKIELAGGRGGKNAGIEVYDCGRYFAVTGKRLAGMKEIINVDDALAWLVDKYNMKQTFATVSSGEGITAETPLLERAARYVEKMEPSISGSRGHDKCYKAACALVMGFNLSENDAYQVLASSFNLRCDPPWTERELRHKLQSAAKQPGQRGYLSDAKPSDWQKIFVRSPKWEQPEEEQDSGERKQEHKPDTTGVRRTTLEDATLDYLDQIVSGIDPLIETGIPGLDYAIGGGVAMGEMVIVAARPSHGKSAIALQMVHHATANGLPAVIVSEEMSALAIGKRTIQYATKVPLEHWKTKSLDVLSDLNFHFDKRASAVVLESCGTAKRVVEEVERCVVETQAKIVAVDYVQLLAAKGKNRYEQVTEASQEMRRLASRLGIIVVVLAQLNRQVEGRQAFIPMMSDLKETGQLEQDADVIVFGVWPHRMDASKPKREYQFFVGKNRNRAINSSAFTVTFDAARQMLVEDSEACEVKRDEHLSGWNNG